MAVSDGGVLIAEEGGSVDGDEAAIELVNPKDSFQALPELNPDIANHWYVCGPSGSGKSTAASKIAEQFKKITDGLVIVLSMDSEEDDSFTCADVRLSVNESADLTLDDLMGEGDDDTGERQRTMVVFDDHLSGADPAITAAVLLLQRAVIERGRKFGVSSITTAHRPATGASSKFILAGCTHFCFFPMHGAGRSLRYTLETYCQVPGEIVSLLRRDPVGWGRCCTLKLSAPMCCIGHRRAMILDPEHIESTFRALKKKMVKKALVAAEGHGSDDDERDGTPAALAIAAARGQRKN